MSRSLYLTVFFAAALFVFGASAEARAQSSYTGSKEGFVGSKAKKPVVPLEDMSEDEFNDEMERTKPRLPPVFESVQTPTAMNNDGTAAATAEDPCAAYLGNFDGYTLCQDRMQKIQKLKDGKQTRKEMYGTQQKTRASEQRRIDAKKLPRKPRPPQRKPRSRLRKLMRKKPPTRPRPQQKRLQK